MKYRHSNFLHSSKIKPNEKSILPKYLLEAIANSKASTGYAHLAKRFPNIFDRNFLLEEMDENLLRLAEVFNRNSVASIKCSLVTLHTSPLPRDICFHKNEVDRTEGRYIF